MMDQRIEEEEKEEDWRVLEEEDGKGKERIGEEEKSIV